MHEQAQPAMPGDQTDPAEATGGVPDGVDGEPPAAGGGAEGGAATGPRNDTAPGGGESALPAGGDGDLMDMWPATPRTVPRARRKLAEALDGWGLKDIAATATLVLSELVTNAVTHSHARGHLVQTRFIRTDRGVRLEVHDASRALPVKQRATDDAEEGRGLALVEALTGPECWGYGSRTGIGKMVWAYVEPRSEDDDRTAGTNFAP
jgi:anti-sigma regulatory factor (Ser/Thr protein kinase)